MRPPRLGARGFTGRDEIEAADRACGLPVWTRVLTALTKNGTGKRAIALLCELVNERIARPEREEVRSLYLLLAAWTYD